MAIPEVISQALTPHAGALSKLISGKFDQVLSRLDDIARSTKQTGRPGLDHWQYFGAAAGGAVQNSDFAIPLMAQKNEVLTIQSITVDATSAVIIRCGGALRYYLQGPKTEKVSGAVVVMPGEVVTFDSSAACNITLGIVREVVTPRGIQKDLGISGHNYSGKNTHEIERDVIESRTGLWDEPEGETRAGEGLGEHVRFPA